MSEKFNGPERRKKPRPTAAFVAWATLFAERRVSQPDLTPAQFNRDLFAAVRRQKESK